MASKIIEEGIDIISANSDSFNYNEDRRQIVNASALSSDSDSSPDSDDDISSDSDNDTSFLNRIPIEEDNPILTDQQKQEILLLKPLLQQEGKRPKRYFTKEEYNIGIMITRICNKNQKSYILGLEVLFSEARARAILNKIVS